MEILRRKKHKKMTQHKPWNAWICLNFTTHFTLKIGMILKFLINFNHKQAVWINLLYWNDFTDWNEKKL